MEPFDTIDAWQREAAGDPGVPYAHAACLATGEPGGVDARMVLVHEMGEGGFVFATDARTAKARAATDGAPGALVFYWGPLDRQVRVRGRLRELTEAIADRCFAERPRGSRVTAHVTRQSAVLEDARELEARYAREAQALEGAGEIPRPAHWRAYALVPESIELWEARRDRLHVRRRFRRDGGGWIIERLEP